MRYEINETHDPTLRSWIESANRPNGDFPIQNLPFGVYRKRGPREKPRVGVAIGDQIVDVVACRRAAYLSAAADSCEAPNLNRLMAAGRDTWSTIRRELGQILRDGSYRAREMLERYDEFFVGAADVDLLLPAEVGDYTDFYASVHHATNVGSMFRPDNPLLPNYKYVPIGYHGRASSLVPSGTAVRRPSGQTRGPNDDAPTFGPTRSLDYELEVGCFIGPGNRLGEPIPVADAEEHIFGVCLVNDWSARDIQSWEYQPLGPFLAKNFATTVSPWVVTMEALEPFRAPAPSRPTGDPAPLPYLDSRKNAEAGAVAVTVEVYLSSARMRETGLAPLRLSRASAADLYWTPAQLLAHHTSNGCNLQPGDLLATGTISGPAKESRGCMLELTWRGANPLTLPNGETRKWLEDGDRLTITGWAQGDGYRIGFGEVTGRVLPA